jgi:hypothetical protein
VKTGKKQNAYLHNSINDKNFDHLFRLFPK